MAEISSIVKLQIISGKANPAPPIGSTLGQRGVNIMGFCKEFNERTKDMGNVPVPVIITIYKDKTFTFVVKKPPVTFYIKKLAGLESGSKNPGREIVKRIKKSDLLEIAKEKMTDMNCFSVEQAVSMLSGSARSMGILIIEG